MVSQFDVRLCTVVDVRTYLICMYAPRLLISNNLIAKEDSQLNTTTELNTLFFNMLWRKRLISVIGYLRDEKLEKFGFGRPEN